jgi:hypothetical protein
MKGWLQRGRLTGGALAMLLAAFPAWGACGLDQCSPRDPTAGFALETSTQFVGSQFATEPAASALQAIAGVDARWSNGISVGARLPVVHAWSGGAAASGLGNAMALAEWQAGVGTVRAAGGLQVEIPSSTAPVLGDAHWMLLPYVRASARVGAFEAHTVQAWGQSLSGKRGYDRPVDTTHAHAFVVNPHADAEWLGRLDLGAVHRSGRGALGVRADGVVEQGGQAMLSVGPTARVQWRNARVAVAATHAVGATTRETWRLWSGVTFTHRRKS